MTKKKGPPPPDPDLRDKWPPRRRGSGKDLGERIAEKITELTTPKREKK
jgi:hypothetical protein